ncbi:Sdh5 domain containing protein [Sulfitobacter noctilucae]|uniref:succinate dehydrogenase assembly factor 2 n=1 Tax=Sulfitobacter noctilucae TaxID=1342302 RepID=UPI000B0C73D7|nr:Sdh5 domain containing protein [Sulfitobacter noctilucae]
MRSIRRGIKEMDLILTAYAEGPLPNLDDAGLELYDALLNENDHDLYQWVTGQVAAPAQYGAMIGDIRDNFSPLG